ncbi:MAG: hypothetical protein ACOCY1_05885 [Halovenus sp.]
MSLTSGTAVDDLPRATLKNPEETDTSLDRILVEVAAAQAAGDTDALDGGVAIPTIVPHVSVSHDAVRERMILLVEEGRLDVVVGKSPETHVIRRSYRVPEDVDLPDDIDARGDYGGEQR